MTRFCAIQFACIAVVILPSAVAAQNQGPPWQYEHVKGLAPFIGFWVSDVERPDGAQSRLTASVRWTSRRTNAQFQITDQVGDERTHIATLIFGWNGADQQLHGWSFAPDHQAHGKVSIDGNKLTYRLEGVALDGSKMSGDATFEVDGDTMRMKVTNFRSGDKEVPEIDRSFDRRERRRRR